MKTPKGKVFDKRLGQWISLKSFRVLRLCPLDTFFTAQSSGLHGSTLKALYRAGYLNGETSKDGLHLEYYLNNHGLRLRRMNVADMDRIPLHQ